MKAWHVFLLASSLWMQLSCSIARSCFCYGTASDPTTGGRCQCKLLSRSDATDSYLHKFTSSEPESTTSTNQPQFLSYPKGGTFAYGVKITLSCNISYVSIPGQDPPFTVTWEHNGTAVETSDTTMTGTAVYFSTFTAEYFTESTQGDYVCRANNGNYSVVSPVATLQLPKFFGWIDRAYPIKSDTDIVNLTVLKGGSVILECLPNTTESLEGITTVWPEQNKVATTTLLSSGNMLVRDVQEDANFSCIRALRQAKERTFIVKVSEPPDAATTTHDLMLVVRPKDRIVVAGSSVELYCIPRSNASIQWLKDGVQIEGVTAIGVLQIQEATVDDTGNYTCIASNDHTSDLASATVTVIGPPTNVTLSASGNGIIRSGSDVIIPASAVNVSFSLHCHVDTNEAVYYQWWFGGVLIGSGYDRETLSVVSSDPWNVTGSYQCIVSNIAGQASPTAISVLIKKPDPPTNVKIRKNTSTYFQYDIRWDQPEKTWKYSITNYTVQTLAYQDRYRAYFCSCPTQPETYFPFLAGCPGTISREHLLFYRVAANTASAGQSDFTHEHGSITIEADAPPQANDLKAEKKINRTSHMWDVTVDWSYRDEDAYGPNCYDTHVTPPCGTIASQMDVKPFKSKMNCCTTCTWSVTNVNFFYNKSNSTSSNVTTGAISPSKPPHLKSARHSGTNFSLSFELPKEPEVSCLCGLKSVEATVCITNTTFKYCKPKSVSVNDKMLSIDLPSAHCSKTYNVSLAFHNSEGISDFSDVRVSGPTGDVGKFSKELSITDDDENVTVYYELRHGAECLLKDGYLQSRICSKLFTKGAVCSSALVNDSDANCSSIDTEKGYITLPRYHKYCVAADISGLSRDSLFLVISANENIPIGKPKHLVVELSDGIMAKWVAPPFTEWRGIPRSFSVNVSVDNRLVNLTSVLVEESLNDYEILFPITEEGDNYTVAVSSCTSVGCGPSAKETKNVRPTSKPAEKGMNTVIVVVLSLAGLVLVVSTILLASCICCGIRTCKKKKSNGLGDMSCLIPPLSDSEAREPVIGEPARSVYTEYESLDPRVREWVEGTAVDQHQPDGSRDGYMKSIDEELEHLEKREGEQILEPTGVPSSTDSSVPVTARVPEVKSDYCSESEALLHSDIGRQTSGTGSSSPTFLQQQNNISTNVSSSGYNTERSFAPFDIESSPSPPQQISCYQTATSSALDRTTAAAYHRPMNQGTSSRSGCTTQLVADSDWMSRLLCTEEFVTQNESGCKDTSPIQVPPVSSTVIPKLPPVQTDLYVNGSSNQHDDSSLYTTSSPATSVHSLESTEGEESDSVFDNSNVFSPLLKSTTNETQRRTRSSGFYSLSGTSPDSVLNDNVEMTSFHFNCHSQQPSHSKVMESRSRTMPVIPSCLPQQYGTHQPTLPDPTPNISSYVNVDLDESASISFDFPSCS